MKAPSYCEVCVIEELQKETEKEIKNLRTTRKNYPGTVADIKIRLDVLKSRKKYLASKIKEILED